MFIVADKESTHSCSLIIYFWNHTHFKCPLYLCSRSHHLKMPKSKKKRRDEEEVYVVERIVKKRVRDGVIEYFLKWKDYPDSENTWEPKDNLDCPELIEEYERKLAAKATSSDSDSAMVVPSSKKAKLNIGSGEKVKRSLQMNFLFPVHIQCVGYGRHYPNTITNYKSHSLKC